MRDPIHPGHVTLTRDDGTTIEETISDGNGIADILRRHSTGEFVEAAHGGGSPDAEPLTVWRWRTQGNDSVARWWKAAYARTAFMVEDAGDGPRCSLCKAPVDPVAPDTQQHLTCDSVGARHP